MKPTFYPCDSCIYLGDKCPGKNIEGPPCLLTCDTCTDKEMCEYAYDPYNLDGDCLILK